MTTEHDIYLYIIKYKMNNDGNPPSVRHLCRMLNIASTATVKYALDSLEENGLIERLPGEKHIVVVGGQWLPPT